MWKEGQKLVCVDNSGAVNSVDKSTPKKGEVVTLHSYSPYDSGWIRLVEYLRDFDGGIVVFRASAFRPIETRKDAKKDLLNQFIEVVESPDCPIQTPQTV